MSEPESDRVRGFKLVAADWGSRAWLGYLWIAVIFAVCVGIIALFAMAARPGG